MIVYRSLYRRGKTSVRIVPSGKVTTQCSSSSIIEDDPYFLYANGGYSTLIFCDGLTHLDFHQPQEAEKIFAQIDGLGPKMHVSEKVRISLLNCQTTIFIELNDMEQACLYLAEAVKASLILGSKKLYHESLEIFAQMKGRWEGEKRVKSLGDLFQA